MKKKIVLFGSLFVLLSCSTVPCEKLGIQKKKKNLEQDAVHMLMKKLEILYKLSATNNNEILNKEIEALKKQIDQLQQKDGVIEGENLGHLLESDAANESTKKTIFGVDEDDLDNYDADFTGQSKGKIRGQSSKDQKKMKGNDEKFGQASGEGVTVTDGSEQNDTSASSPGNGGAGSPPAAPAAPAPQAESSSVTPPGGQSPNGRVPNVKYLDKLYDEVLNTSEEKNAIHVPAFHSKYNDFRTKYEFTMNEQEYHIVKKLFDAFFKKEQNSSYDAPIKFFKNVLNDAEFQKQFDNFQHGLYGFAKRHNYLRGDRMTDGQLYSELLKNVINLLNTIEIN
ncbi:merozoite surface protein 7 [Plasmodium cynomolgi strain B]|uniref:Merozoite surface protein 7 n=1 Tax=Plasmodium cynomolgi (strain B) TaxID=1120755 RepID=K6UE45_PLACD|nr:merozoite surface protein 7 [Plasmodium cynomolgi strain B]GAB67711.1 merozoite surface protein 7 [Plasmodium cynomolgi strain B]